MYTSYYGKSKKNPNAVSITAYKPTWFVGKYYPDLAPTWDLVNRHKSQLITDSQYEKEYLDLLKNRGITPLKVLEDLGNEAILLCFEAKGKFCHRHIVAKWLQNDGVECSEL